MNNINGLCYGLMIDRDYNLSIDKTLHFIIKDAEKQNYDLAVFFTQLNKDKIRNFEVEYEKISDIENFKLQSNYFILRNPKELDIDLNKINDKYFTISNAFAINKDTRFINQSGLTPVDGFAFKDLSKLNLEDIRKQISEISNDILTVSFDEIDDTKHDYKSLLDVCMNIDDEFLQASDPERFENIIDEFEEVRNER